VANKIAVGGQAVLEGVMMRSPRAMAVAVRRPDGSIAEWDEPWRGASDRFPVLKRPFLRGVVTLVESLVNGLQALSYSAREAFPQEDRKAGKDGPGNLELGLTMTAAFAAAVLLFVAIPHGVAYLVGERFEMPIDAIGFHLVDGVVKVAVLVAYISAISLMKDIRRVFEYHGAEHMSINAYEAGEELTVENARRHSTLHPRCGTAFLLLVLVVSVFLFAAFFPFMPRLASGEIANQGLYVLVKIPLIFPLAGATYELIKWADKHRKNAAVKVVTAPGLALQRLTTRTPSDDQIEVALAALKSALNRESQVDVR